MTKSVKIPKKIAGVKLHKQARKTANRAIKTCITRSANSISDLVLGCSQR